MSMLGFLEMMFERICDGGELTITMIIVLCVRNFTL